MDTENRRTSKEFKIPNDGLTNIKSRYGALDKNNPEILYIRSRATITPSIKKKDFSENIIEVKKIFEKNIKTVILNSKAFEKKYICSIEISENGIAFGKKSHVKYDIYVKPKMNKAIEEYYDDVQTMVYLFNQKLSQLLIESNINIE